MTDPNTMLTAVVEAQAEHPVYPRLRIELGETAGVVRVCVGKQVLEMPADQAAVMLEGRERSIRLEAEDPFRYGYEPPFWAAVDWAVAELVCKPGNECAVLEVLIQGGNRAGKTDYAAKRFIEALVLNDRWLCWGFHSDQAASRSVQQRRSWNYMPPEHKPATGKLRKTVRARMNYNQESGFTENMFSLPNGSAAHYKFYSADVKGLEGDEPDFCWSDEEIPEEWVEAIGVRLITKAGKRGHLIATLRGELAKRQQNPEHVLPRTVRAQMWRGCHLITFTPISGLTPTVRRFTKRATSLVTVPAELLPIRDGDGGILAYEHVPRVMRCADTNRLVVYFHTYDNLHGGNYQGMVAACRGKTAAWIKCRVYGVTDASKDGRFPQFSRAIHVRPKGPLPKDGTWYHVVDPCNGRNWFMVWALVSPLGQVLVAREWPQPADYVEGVGPMGEWAVPTAGKRLDGDRGPAQASLGWGIKRYCQEIERIERELHRLQHGAGEDGRVEPFVRIIDSRAGNTPTLAASETLTLIDLLANEGMDFEPAGMLVAAEGQSRRNTINEGIDLLNDWLSFDPAAVKEHPDGRVEWLDALKGPRLYLSEVCENTISALETWTGLDGPEGASKDPIDVLRYLRISDPVFVDSKTYQPTGGGGY